MEASALQAPVAIGRITVSGPLLRLRSDEQLVELFRAGSDEAFRAIHDRYRHRLFAYVRQMLAGSRQDAEDAMQDVFIRAYGALRASSRPISLRAWLYRVAHNRCIDQLRRPVPAPSEVYEVSLAPLRDPLIESERREDLRRLVCDIRHLPDQQRSALLMREMQGMTYVELADALEVTVPAVKSLLVRARMGLVEAAEARDTACLDIREDLVVAADRGVRMSGRVRRHMRECDGCREYRAQVRGLHRSFGALCPAAGPFGLLAKLSLGGSGAAGGGALLGGGGLATVSAAKIAVLVCCAAVVTGGALELPQGAPTHPARGAHHPGAAAHATADDLDAVAAAAAPGLAPLLSQIVNAVDGSATRRRSGAHTHAATEPLLDPDPALFAAPPRRAAAPTRDGSGPASDDPKPEAAGSPSPAAANVVPSRPVNGAPTLLPTASKTTDTSPASSSGSGSGASSGPSSPGSTSSAGTEPHSAPGSSPSPPGDPPSASNSGTRPASASAASSAPSP